jgi:signal transduction histidine kinase
MRRETSPSEAERIAGLERDAAKDRRIIEALMNRVERSMDFQGGAFSLFQAAIALDQRVRERTQAAEQALLELEKSNRALAQAKDAAETAQSRLVEAISSVNGGFAIFDAEDRLVLCNERYLDLWTGVGDRIRPGMAFAEIVKLAAESGSVVAARENAEGWIADRLRQHANAAEPYVYQLADRRWIQINERRTAEGGIVGIYTDVSDVKRAESDLRQAKTVAEQANLSKTKFLAAAGHDLLQPLNAARLFLAALGEIKQTPQSRRLLERTDAALLAVEDLLEALLDISKLDAGVVLPQRTDFAISSLLGGLESEAAAVAAARGLKLSIVPSSAIVNSDQRLLRRLVQNFLSNALRYTGSGRILVGCRRRPGALRIEVWDTGPGIPDDKLSVIFEEFRQLDAKPAGEERGMGLGLAIVERIARMLGHSVTVASRPGKGSMFAVAVPLGEAAHRREASPVARTRPATMPFAGNRVLVVDNDAGILEGMRALLGRWGCLVATADSREAALKLLDEPGPDAVLIDHHLSHGEIGFDCLDAIDARLGRSVPAALITADRSGEITDRARERGLVVLHKPVKPSQLRGVVMKLLVDR